MKKLTPIQKISAIAIFILTVVVFFSGFYVLSKYQWAHDLIESSTLKYGRFAGLIDGRNNIDDLQKSSQTELDKLAYPVWKSPDEIGITVEQALREFVKNSQMDLVSIQSFPPQDSHSLDKIVFDIKIEGDILSIHEFFNLVKNQIPFFWIEQINFQASGASRPNTKQRILCQVKIFVLRSR